jgi:hypothetical protein
MDNCPKCVTICKQPHCVTHCQAPKPECEAVCEEPKCDWKCAKPNCPKPKCELVCENPTCVNKAECCNCGMGTPKVVQPFPFFKETESNSNCCGCDQANKGVSFEIPQISIGEPINKMPQRQISVTPNSVTQTETITDLEFFKTQDLLAPPQITSSNIPERDLNRLNGQLRDLHRQ